MCTWTRAVHVGLGWWKRCGRVVHAGLGWWKRCGRAMHGVLV